MPHACYGWVRYGAVAFYDHPTPLPTSLFVPEQMSSAALTRVPTGSSASPAPTHSLAWTTSATTASAARKKLVSTAVGCDCFCCLAAETRDADWTRGGGDAGSKPFFEDGREVCSGFALLWPVHDGEFGSNHLFVSPIR